MGQEITSQVLGGVAKGLYPDLDNIAANIQVSRRSIGLTHRAADLQLNPDIELSVRLARAYLFL